MGRSALGDPNASASANPSARASATPTGGGTASHSSAPPSVGGDYTGTYVTTGGSSPATIDIQAVRAAWREHGIAGYVSDSAGTYLCNMAMYTALTLTASDGVPAGFIHVTQLVAQAATADRLVPSMSLQTMVDGIRVALEAAWAAASTEANAPQLAQSRR